ncbi:MAG: hypothetical protein ABI947_16305 [Chloroflexota bacterium]
MKKFFRLIFITVTLLSLLCMVAILLGYRQRESVFISELHYCDSTICYLGIVPGITTWDKALPLIRQTTQLDALDDLAHTYGHKEPAYTVGFLVGGDQDTPIEININLTSAKVYAGDLITKFGNPCYVVSFTDGLLGLGYPNALFTVPTHRLTPFSLIDHVVLLRDKQNACPPVWPPGSLVVDGWQGFITYPVQK